MTKITTGVNQFAKYPTPHFLSDVPLDLAIAYTEVNDVRIIYNGKAYRIVINGKFWDVSRVADKENPFRINQFSTLEAAMERKAEIQKLILESKHEVWVFAD